MEHFFQQLGDFFLTALNWIFWFALFGIIPIGKYWKQITRWIDSAFHPGRNRRLAQARAKHALSEASRAQDLLNQVQLLDLDLSWYKLPANEREKLDQQIQRATHLATQASEAYIRASRIHNPDWDKESEEMYQVMEESFDRVSEKAEEAEEVIAQLNRTKNRLSRIYPKELPSPEEGT